MGLAGYNTIVKRGGTSTAMSDEPMTLVSGSIYQLNDTAKRIFDRTVVPTFEDDGVSPQSDLTVTAIDYMFGRVTLSAPAAGNVTLKTGNFIPTVDIAGANNYSLNHGGDVLPDSSFDKTRLNGGNVTRILGIRDVSVSISKWDVVTDSFFFTALNSRTPVVIDIQPGGSGNPIFRGWFVTESQNRQGDISSLESSDLSFQLEGEAIDSYGIA
jgi:hypothetical protein